MAERRALFSLGFLAINVQFALVTSIAALFFAFSGYLEQLGVAPALSGFILSADALAALVVQPLIAPLIDPASARRWLTGGALLLCVALFALARVTGVPLLIAARLAQGAGFICVLSALIALMVGCIPAGMSGRAFGFASLVRLLPYALVPFVFDRCALAAGDFARVLDIAALLALAPLLMLALPTAPAPKDGQTAGAPGWSGLRASLRERPVAALLASALLFFCGYATVFFFLRQFGQARAIANANLFFSVTTLMMIAVRLGASALFDRFDKSRLCRAGLLTSAACYALLPLCTSTGAFLALAAATGIGWGIAMPLQAATLFDISAAPARAMNQNLLLVMMQGGFFLGPCVGGLLISAFGYGALFATLAATTLLAALLMAGARAPRAAP